MIKKVLFTCFSLTVFLYAYPQIGVELGTGFSSISTLDKPKIFSSDKNISTFSGALIYNVEQYLFVGLGAYQKNYSFDSTQNIARGLFVPFQLQLPTKIYYNRQVGRRCRYATFDIMLGNDFAYDFSQVFNGALQTKKLKNTGKYGFGFSFGTSRILVYSSFQSQFSYGKRHTLNNVMSKERGVKVILGFSITSKNDFSKM